MEIYYKFPILCAYPHLHFSWLKFTNWVVILSSLVIVKVKVLRIAGHWGPEGEERYCSTLSWPGHLDGGGGGRTTPQPLYPRERPGTHCIGGWVGPRAGLDGCGKSRPPPPGFYLRTVQPVAESLYRLRYPGLCSLVIILLKWGCCRWDKN